MLVGWTDGRMDGWMDGERGLVGWLAGRTGVKPSRGRILEACVMSSQLDSILCYACSSSIKNRQPPKKKKKKMDPTEYWNFILSLYLCMCVYVCVPLTLREKILFPDEEIQELFMCVYWPAALFISVNHTLFWWWWWFDCRFHIILRLNY